MPKLFRRKSKERLDSKNANVNMDVIYLTSHNMTRNRLGGNYREQRIKSEKQQNKQKVQSFESNPGFGLLRVVEQMGKQAQNISEYFLWINQIHYFCIPGNNICILVSCYSG